VRKEARAKAQDLLARREHSRVELTRKLEARGFDRAVVADVLDVLERERLLSDARFSEQFAHQRAERGHGPLKILNELAQRGIDEDTAREYVNLLDPVWFERALKAKSKRFGRAPPSNLKDRARQSRFLAQRGYTADQTAKALGAGESDEETE